MSTPLWGYGGQYKGAEIDEKTMCLRHIVGNENRIRQRKTVYAIRASL
jgi:hypothetical protein